MKNIKITLLKKQAKEIKKEHNVSHMEALDMVAQKIYYDSWTELLEESQYELKIEHFLKNNKANIVLKNFVRETKEEIEILKEVISLKNKKHLLNYLFSLSNKEYPMQETSKLLIKIILELSEERKGIFDIDDLLELINVDNFINEINQRKKYKNKKLKETVENFKDSLIWDGYRENKYLKENWIIFTIEAKIRLREVKYLCNNNFFEKNENEILLFLLNEKEFINIMNNKILNQNEPFILYYSLVTKKGEYLFNSRNSHFKEKNKNLINKILKTGYLKEKNETFDNNQKMPLRVLKVRSKKFKDLNFYSNKILLEKDWESVINKSTILIKTKKQKENNRAMEDLKEVADNFKDYLEAINSSFKDKTGKELAKLLIDYFNSLNYFTPTKEIISSISFVFVNTTKVFDSKYLLSLFDINKLAKTIKENELKEEDIIKELNTLQLIKYLNRKNNDATLENLSKIKKQIERFLNVFDFFDLQDINEKSILQKTRTKSFLKEFIKLSKVNEYFMLNFYIRRALRCQFENKNLNSIHKKHNELCEIYNEENKSL